MKKRHTRLVSFIAVPVLIFAMGVLFIPVIFSSAITRYIENTVEKKIGSQLDQASGDSLSINIQELKFSLFPITVSTPEISVYAATNALNKNSTALPCNYVYEAAVINLEISLKPLVLIALGFKNLNVNRLQSDNIYFSTKCLSKKTGAAFNSRLKIQSGPILFKGKIELPAQDNNGVENLKFKQHSFQAANLSFISSQNLYSFHIDSISFDGSMKTLNLEKVKMLPKYAKEELYRHVDFETNSIETRLDNIEIKGLQTQIENGKRGLMISRINIRNGLIDVFRDKRPPFNMERRPAMPARLILSAPIDLFIAEINISQTSILYSQFPENGSESEFHESSGNLSFNRLSATVRNITNIADSLQQDSIMHIIAEAHIYDVALLRADFRYNLKDIDGGYMAEVNVSEFQFETINPVLYPLTGIKVARGTHKSSLLSFTGNDTESNGELYMEWDDLMLNFKPKTSGLITDITNSFGKIIYNQSNPDDATKSPTGSIYYKRDISRFVFHYWWNCYLSGIKNSVLPDFVPL
ncbi:MAG: hypothetical protein R6U85_11750 [Salinivirgaceae bacterium]